MAKQPILTREHIKQIIKHTTDAQSDWGQALHTYMMRELLRRSAVRLKAGRPRKHSTQGQ